MSKKQLSQLSVPTGPESLFDARQAECPSRTLVAVEDCRGDTPAAFDNQAWIQGPTCAPRGCDPGAHVLRGMLPPEVGCQVVTLEKVVDLLVAQVGQDGKTGRGHSQREADALAEHVRPDWEAAVLADQADRLVAAPGREERALAGGDGQAANNGLAELPLDGSPTRRLRFLVVDDNEDIRDVFCRFVERSGHLSSTAKDGQEAVEVLEREVFDVMLLDLAMPRMGGIEVVRWIQAHPDAAPGMRVVVISAWAGEARGVLGFASCPDSVRFLRNARTSSTVSGAVAAGDVFGARDNGSNAASPSIR